MVVGWILVTHDGNGGLRSCDHRHGVGVKKGVKWGSEEDCYLNPFRATENCRSRARPSTHRARPLEVAHCIRDASHLPGTPTARSCSREDQPYDLLLPGCLPFARVEAADQRQKINSSTLRSLGPVDSLDLFYMYKNSARGHIPDLVTMLWP